MGYNVEHAIVVTSWDKELISKAHKKALELFPNVSQPVDHIANGGQSFLVPPDGSKAGWPESDEGDQRRAMFVKWLEGQRYDDHSTSLRWVEVMYADDEHRVEIVSGDHQGHK